MDASIAAATATAAALAVNLNHSTDHKPHRRTLNYAENFLRWERPGLSE